MRDSLRDNMSMRDSLRDNMRDMIRHHSTQRTLG